MGPITCPYCNKTIWPLDEPDHKCPDEKYYGAMREAVKIVEDKLAKEPKPYVRLSTR